MPSTSRSVFEKMQTTNKKKIEYFLVKGGEEQPQNPCTSGFHMFYQASNEALQAIDQFANSISGDAK